MRIVSLEVRSWRNFRNVNFEIPSDKGLICLIGENGTGKSNLLELISAAASQVGISPGLELSRGNPFSEPHDISISFQFSESLQDLLNEQQIEQLTAQGVEWDGSITLQSRREEGAHNRELIAGGQGDLGNRQQIAQLVNQAIRSREETNYLTLDADRSYPPVQINDPQYAQALGMDWDTPQQKKHRAFIPTRTMYDEWTKYFLAMETQSATELQREMRRAKEQGLAPPEFVDFFESYKESVSTVLPHLKFVGVDTQQKTLVFDSAGLELRFTSLSGGEREIAFIIGQIERFQLRSGLLLVDEPELHLNPDLLRNWVAYLRDTIEDGQIWISTHSLEAVEATGPESTFVLERTPDTRLVESVSSLANRPVLSVLSAAVGSPAFSLSKLRFVYVEGDRQGRERERFYRLYGDSRYVRFIEGGGCEEVARKLFAVRELAEDADEQLTAGGVIDRDFRTDNEIEGLSARTPIHVLECHEVENLFLQPDVLQVIIDRAGIDGVAGDLVRQAADRFAGLWVLGQTIARSTIVSESTKPLRQAAGEVDWNSFEESQNEAIESLVHAALEPGDAQMADFAAEIVASLNSYRDLRNSQQFWMKCMGKEVSSVMPAFLGLSSSDVLQNNVLEIFESGVVEKSEELRRLINYIDTFEAG